MGAVVFSCAVPALAVEGALGRTIPGIWIQPQGAVVGPKPGFMLTTMPIGYMGRLGGSREAPFGGSIFANVKVDLSSNWVIPQYVYNTETTKVSFSSSFLGSVNWLDATGSLEVNGRLLGSSKSTVGIGDVAFTPLTAGFHFSDYNNLAVSMMVFAPTGHYSPANLTNLGMGEWTIMPNVGHTYLWKKRGLEFDNLVGFDIYSKNTTTNYKSGTMFHW